LRWDSHGLSHVGRRRLSNQDAFLIDPDLGLYVVADGMGGHNAGEVASQEAVEALHSMVKTGAEALDAVGKLPPDGTWSPEGIQPVMARALRVLESAIQAATYMIFGMAQNNPDQKGMGTTMSVLVLRGAYALTAQVGDSRVYLVRGGQASQLTEDHTLVAWQLKKGLISPEEARTSPQKNVITRAVGSRDYVQVDTRFLRIEPRDAFLLCSDGLYGYLEDGEIPAVMALGARTSAERFIEIANQRGGRDNITVLTTELVD
jgi:protein phosphatase